MASLLGHSRLVALCFLVPFTGRPLGKAWNRFFRYCQLSVIARHPENEIVTGFKLVIFSGNRLALRKSWFRCCVPGPCCDCAYTEGKTARQKKMKKPAKHRRFFFSTVIDLTVSGI